MFAIEPKFLQCGHSKLVIMIIAYGSHCRAQHLQGQRGDWLGWRIHPVNNSLKLFVSEGRLLIVPLYNPANDEIFNECQS